MVRRQKHLKSAKKVKYRKRPYRTKPQFRGSKRKSRKTIVYKKY